MATLDAHYRVGDYPDGWYHCSVCEAHHCKLWRTREWELEHVELFCGLCVLNLKVRQIVPLIDEEGVVYGLGDPTYVIGTAVPAIPESGVDVTCYPHLQAKPAAWAWWVTLRSYPIEDLRSPRWHLLMRGTGL